MKMNFAPKIFFYCALFVSLFSFGQTSNDQCSGAINLTMGSSCTTGSIVTANTTTGDPTTKPTCWSFANDDGVWFKFTPTATTANITFTTGGTYIPMAAVYNGGVSPGTCPAAGATPISGGCLNYSTNSAADIALSGLTVGNTYYVLVDMPSTTTGTFCTNVWNGPGMTTAGSSCPATINSTVNLITCADIGTPVLENSSGVVTYSNAGSAIPSPAPTCGSSFTGGSWAHYDLAAGVTALTFNWENEYGGSAATGNHNIYAQIYQGSSCAALTTFSCAQIGSFSAGIFSVGNAVIQNLNPAQDVWVYFFDDSNKAFNLPYDVVGSSTPTNDGCSGSIMSSIGCNLGSTGDAWGTGGTSTISAPESAIAGGSSSTCSGTQAWTSNENTVWYTFSATTTTANISVSNVICNDGTTGTAQFAAFTNCSCPTVNSYATSSCFLGCTVGSGTINLGSLLPGQTVYLAVDGTAGDVCKMDFITTLTVLPITWLDFDAFVNNHDVKLFWSTASEKNTSYFEIERSEEGFDFYPIGHVKAFGNSEEKKDYVFIDYNLHHKQAYYRLKQFDADGQYFYSKIISVNLDAETKSPEIFFNESEKLINIKSYSKGFDNYDVEILDSFGKLVMDPQDTNFESDNIYSISLNNLPNGVYIINMKSKQGYKSFTKKMVIY